MSSAGLQALLPFHSKTSTTLLIELGGTLAYINKCAIRHYDKIMTTLLTYYFNYSV